MNNEIRYINTNKEVRDLRTWLNWKRRRRSFEPSPAEQQAFDLGYEAGLNVGATAENPYEHSENSGLWEAWETGHSVGMLGRDENSVDSEENRENISR